MPALTRRREKDRPQESWQVFYGDVRIGWIGERAGGPKTADQWGWTCGFYPRDRQVSGTAGTFDQARADFEAAWRDYLAGCTDADFEQHRRQEAWTKWKYAMSEAGCSMPTQKTDGRSRCFCGAEIDNATTHDHIVACHMEVAA